MNHELHFQTFLHDEKSPWVVLIHGLFGNLDNLAALRRHLESQFNVLAIDLPNHGLSKWVSSFSLQDCVKKTDALLAQLHIESAFFVGHSLGGKVAMMMALQFPHRVKKLIVADIAPVSYPPHHQAVFKGLSNTDLHQVKSRSDADNQLRQFVEEPGTRQFLLKSLYQDEQKQWHWRFNFKGLEQDYHAIGNWPEINTQYHGDTLFIKGGKSNYIMPEYKEAITKYFPNAKAHVVEGTGHWLHAEKAPVFNKIVERALTKP